MDHFSSNKFYQRLRGEFPKVAWRKMVCNNLGLPKWIFVLRLAAHGKLYTRDRLSKWVMTSDTTCPLCGQETESHSHLFFAYEVAAQVWHKLLKWKGINRRPRNWEDELQWAIKFASG
ncbi:PREDICTED: uncharacterized protein LOC109208841, partial [Nicotiana attenuata]|uniref:uncharacterized protein LOC109208841 n=1 Tax=Nicotiana attenuata TaxID=49451 RepID=UPI0009057354